MSIPNLAAEKTKIGWIGTGIMGHPMCVRLLDRGFSVSVHDLLKDKAADLLEKGAEWAGSPKEAALGSDVVCSIVSTPAQVRQIMFGEDGVLAGIRSGGILVEMTTSEPSRAKEIYAAAKEREVSAIDAPVSGGSKGAEAGTLSIMIGGDQETIDALGPLWTTLGKNIVHTGGAGSGQHAKAVNQILIASNLIGVCEALLYGYRAGLDLAAILEALQGGAGGSWQLSTHGSRTIQNNFSPGFMVDHFTKDLGIVLAETARMGVSLPGTALVHQLFLAVQAQGHGGDATNALELTLAKLSGIDWQHRDEG